MSYFFQPCGQSIRIIDPDAEFLFGHVDLPQEGYRVQDAQGNTIAVVNSINDALPILLDHYEKHPPQWMQDSVTEYSKDTRFGLLSVGQEPLGFWSVYRNYHTILLHNGKPSVFRTADEAKAAADAHLRDETGEVSSDGYEWFSMR
jgi:hypothetical protein